MQQCTFPLVPWNARVAVCAHADYSPNINFGDHRQAIFRVILAIEVGQENSLPVVEYMNARQSPCF
jgi:hypothetical protein